MLELHPDFYYSRESQDLEFIEFTLSSSSSHSQQLSKSQSHEDRVVQEKDTCKNYQQPDNVKVKDIEITQEQEKRKYSDLDQFMFELDINDDTFVKLALLKIRTLSDIITYKAF